MQQKERNPAKSHKFTTKVDVFPRFHTVFSHVFFHVSTSTSWHKVQGKILDVSFLKNLAYVESQGKIPKVTSSKPTSSKPFSYPPKTQKKNSETQIPKAETVLLRFLHLYPAESWFHRSGTSGRWFKPPKRHNNGHRWNARWFLNCFQAIEMKGCFSLAILKAFLFSPWFLNRRLEFRSSSWLYILVVFLMFRFLRLQLITGAHACCLWKMWPMANHGHCFCILRWCWWLCWCFGCYIRRTLFFFAKILWLFCFFDHLHRGVLTNQQECAILRW